MNDLNRRAWGGLLFLLLSLGVMLFLPAGTLDYWQAWIFLGVFSVSVVAITLYLMKNDPKLLERRVNAGPVAEKEARQKVIQGIASIAFIAVIVLPAVDRRFGLSIVPTAIVIAGDVLVALGLWIVFLVFKENSFTSAVIELAPKQKVVSTGPYALVRHPMYSGALVMLIGVPLALGSWWGEIAIVPMTLVLVWRLLDEEDFLDLNLSGYSEYRRAVRYRLLPCVW